MNPELLGRYSIAGIGETPIGHLPDQTPLSLALQAARLAILDAGLQPGDIDGVICEYPYSEPRFLYPLEIAEAFGIRPRHASSLDLGGASAVAALGRAAAAIDAGLCERVLFVNSDLQFSRRRSPSGLNWGYQDLEEPFGLMGAVGGYALAAQAHMRKYGTPPESFGEIAVATRLHASLNPGAQKREPFTLQDYLASPFVVEPFRLLDCCLISDYGGAFVVTRRPESGRRPAVVLAGFQEGHDHRYLSRACSLVETVAAELSRRLWKQTGLGPADVDCAMLYDSFTYMVLVQLEDYGFCAKGKAPEFLASGAIRRGGSLPVNTHGGLLSQGHANGVFHVCEAVRQLRQEAGPRNLPAVRRALVTGAGGIFMGTHAAALLERVDPA